MACQKLNGSKRYERWFNALAKYDYTIEHYPSTLNSVADHLSRAGASQLKENEFFDLVKIEELQGHTSSSEEMKSFENLKDMEIEGHKIHVDSSERIIVPRLLQRDFVEQLHVKLGHPGTYKLKKNIDAFFVGKGLAKMILNYSRNCNVYQLNKTPVRTYGESTGQALGEKQFSVVCTDIVGPYSLQEFKQIFDSDKFFVITFIDTLTKMTLIELTETITEDKILKTLKKWIRKYGKPERIVSDNGRQYHGKNLKKYCVEKRITQTYVSRFNPQANSTAETINKTISSVLRMGKERNLRTVKQQILHNLNLTYNRSIGCAPYELCYSYSRLDPLRRRIVHDIANIRRSIVKESERRREIMNRSRVKFDLKPGQNVLVKKASYGELDSRLEGPYPVLEVDKKKNRARFEIGTRAIWDNVRRLVPWRCEELQDVAVS